MDIRLVISTEKNLKDRPLATKRSGSLLCFNGNRITWLTYKDEESMKAAKRTSSTGPSGLFPFEILVSKVEL